MNRDDQQVTDLRLGWLAGIWDGEGTIGLVRQNKKSGKTSLVAKVTMENTCTEIIEECQRIFDLLGIKYYITSRKAKTKKHKHRFVIQVVRHAEIRKFCAIMYEHLISKKKQCKLLEEFAVSRYENYRQPNTEKEFEIANELNMLNQLGQEGTSTTLRETLKKQEKNKKRWKQRR